MMPANTIRALCALVFVGAMLAAPAQAEQPLYLYLEGGIGLDREEGRGFLGQRTLGQFSIGFQWDVLYTEFRHESNVQVADDHGGDNAVWFGIRKAWKLN